MMSCDDMPYDVILMTSNDGMMSCHAMSDVMLSLWCQVLWCHVLHLDVILNLKILILQSPHIPMLTHYERQITIT